MLTEEIKSLSKSKKLLLINDLWDDISEDSDDIPISKETEELLDARYKAFQQNPSEGKPWDEVKRELGKKG